MSDEYELIHLEPSAFDRLIEKRGRFGISRAPIYCRGDDTSRVWPEPPPELFRERADAGAKAKDAQSQEGSDASGDVRVQGEQIAQRIEDRPEGEGPQAGDSNRLEAEWTKQQFEKATEAACNAVEQQRRETVERQRAEEAARQGNVLGFKVRVFLTDIQGSWIEFGVTIPWPEWLQRLNAYHGIAHDTGFIPLHAIKLIVHVDAQGNHNLTMGENVVPFKRPPA